MVGFLTTGRETTSRRIYVCGDGKRMASAVREMFGKVHQGITPAPRPIKRKVGWVNWRGASGICRIYLRNEVECRGGHISGDHAPRDAFRLPSAGVRSSRGTGALALAISFPGEPTCTEYRIPHCPAGTSAGSILASPGMRNTVPPGTGSLGSKLGFRR